MRERTKSLVQVNLIVCLLLFPLLIEIQIAQSQSCGAASEDIYTLPACAVDLASGESGRFTNSARLLAVTPRIIVAKPGQEVSITISYQIWLPENSSGSIAVGTFGLQLVFIGSWEPRSPSDYWVVYSGHPPSMSPGKTGSASFHLTAPNATGSYYLWFCFTYPLSTSNPLIPNLASAWAMLKPPGFIKLLIPSQSLTATIKSSITKTVISPPIPNIPLVPVVIVVSSALAVVLLFRRVKRERTNRLICVKCGFHSPAGHEFCSKCGSPLGEKTRIWG